MSAPLTLPDAPVIDIRSLRVVFDGFKALDDVSIEVFPQESFGIVGESGSGKSTLLRAIAGLVAHAAGEMIITGRKLASIRRDSFFYRTVQMVFQDPYGSLHPRQTVERLLLEPLAIHRFDNKQQRIERALDEVGLGKNLRFRYTHQLSGGQRQRVAIARALIIEPQILLLDEPTSALDASIQAEILNLLEEMRQRHGLTFIMVSHDLSVISHMCKRLAVMREGQVVEMLNRSALSARHFSHTYTAELLRASEGFQR